MSPKGLTKPPPVPRQSTRHPPIIHTHLQDVGMGEPQHHKLLWVERVLGRLSARRQQKSRRVRNVEWVGVRIARAVSERP